MEIILGQNYNAVTQNYDKNIRIAQTADYCEIKGQLHDETFRQNVDIYMYIMLIYMYIFSHVYRHIMHGQIVVFKYTNIPPDKYVDFKPANQRHKTLYIQ